MTPKLFESLGGKLAEQWSALSLTPAFAFWLGGLGFWILRRRERLATGDVDPIAWLLERQPHEQLALLLLVLLVVSISAAIVQALDLRVLRLLEGYWPAWFDGARSLRVRSKEEALQALRDERQELAQKSQGGRDRSQLTEQENRRYDRVLERLHWVPADTSQLMPTDLGNALRAAELRPRDKYGLDTIICWPRLWLLLPSQAQQELASARSRLDAIATVWLWSLLFLVWTVLSPWALLALLVTLLAYRFLLDAAEVYGSLLEAAYDVYRVSLYRALRLPLPRTPKEEFEWGTRLTGYLRYGPDREDEQPAFTTARE